MKIFQAGPLRVRAAGGTDRDGGGDGPAILLCHGFGAPGDDLVSLHRAVAVAPSVRWFFPEAPLSLDGGGTGRAWWPIDMLAIQRAIMSGQPRTMKTETPDGLEAARDQLQACIAALETDHAVDAKKLVIGGFSQGAMVTTEVALAGFRPFAGLAILSGAFLCEDRWRPRAKSLGGALHVMQSHGERDPILPFAFASELHEMLVEAGADASFVRFRGQHEIPAVALDAFQTFVNARLTFDGASPSTSG